MTDVASSSAASPAAVLRLVALVLAGIALGGPSGAVVAALGWLAAERAGAAAPLTAALGCLVVTGLATIFEEPLRPAEVSLAFATDRPIAHAAGRATALLLLAALAALAAGERAPRPSHRAGRPLLLATATALATAAVAVAVATAAVVHEATAPPPLDDREVVAARTLRATSALPDGPTGEVPPLTAAIAAFSPGPAGRAATALAGLAVLLLAGQAHGRRRAAAVAATALAAAVTPAVTQLALGPSAAVAALAAAHLLAPGAARGGRALAGGAVGGLGVLAAPESLVAVVALAAWPLVAAPPARRSAAAARAALVLTGVAAVALPWMLRVSVAAAGRSGDGGATPAWAVMLDAAVLVAAVAGAGQDRRTRLLVLVAVAAFVVAAPSGLVGLEDRWLLAPVLVPAAGRWVAALVDDGHRRSRPARR